MRLRNLFVLLALFLGLYAAILPAFTGYMKHKPYAEKLGLVPRPELLKVLGADQKQLLAAGIIGKVILYFGALMQKEETQLVTPPDYPAMSRTIHAALDLDPYNMDGYYFAQSILVWDVRQYRLANALLEQGMKYRTWDWQLPFFAGFNYSFFLKDYPKAAQMYERAGEISGNPLFTRLAGRYLQQSGNTEMAIAYLSTMEKGARDAAVKKAFATRLQAFRAVRAIELARDRYQAERGSLPSSLAELVAAGYLKTTPQDPYGGTFYLKPDGSVDTTSKFSIAGAEKARKGK
jgi:tetratricopeptide (TPR) repeat protein